MRINNSKGKSGVEMGLMAGGQRKELVAVYRLKGMFVKLIPLGSVLSKLEVYVHPRYISCKNKLAYLLHFL